MTEVHEDPYPSRPAMEAAVELEVSAALGRVQTQTVGKVIQRAIDKAVGPMNMVQADMLAALIAVRDDMYHHTRTSRPRTALIRKDALDAVMAAIAKATGESPAHAEADRPANR